MSVWICKLILTFSFSQIILFAWILWKLNTAYEIEARPWGSSLQENKVQWEVASLKPWKDECFWVTNEMENDQHSIFSTFCILPTCGTCCLLLPPGWREPGNQEVLEGMQGGPTTFSHLLFEGLPVSIAIPMWAKIFQQIPEIIFYSCN